MECRNSQDELVFYIRESGSIQFRHNLTGSGVAHMASSTVAGSQSLYVGSTRLSYSHTEHRMLMHQLKADHIPVYLQGRGFTAGDLPAAHGHNDMSVFKWIVHTRDHFSDDQLTVQDVFPPTNDDWFQVDAPADGLIADVQTLQTDVNTLGAAHVGIDADITTLETEIDAAEVRLDALEAAGGGGGGGSPSIYVHATTPTWGSNSVYIGGGAGGEIVLNGVQRGSIPIELTYEVFGAGFGYIKIQSDLYTPEKLLLLNCIAVDATGPSITPYHHTKWSANGYFVVKLVSQPSFMPHANTALNVFRFNFQIL